VTAFPLAHISWALADNDTRKACDAFLTDVFGAETAFELLLTPAVQAMGLDREETLMVVGNTMLISIAPVGPGERPESAIGTMLRHHARPGMWIGLAFSVADLDAARVWARERGFTPKSYAGMEERYFLLDRRSTLGVRLEFLKGDLRNDPRIKPGWKPEWWCDSHPLGIEGLQSIGVSTPSLDTAREIFVGKLGWPELSSRHLPGDGADCTSFLMGDNVIEAMQPAAQDSRLAQHCRDIQGIYCLTFQVRSASSAADYLRNKGLELVGDPATRFAINPDQAFGRLIYFTDKRIEAYPALGTMLGPAGTPSVATF
jgi:hypothetical protein